VALECAQNLFLTPTDNFEWNPQLANMIRIIWTDPGLQETLSRQGKDYILDDPETILYICSNLDRILSPFYSPNQEDYNKSKKWIQQKPEELIDIDNVSTIRDIIFSEVKNLVIIAAKNRQSFGTHRALQNAKQIISFSDENFNWTTEIQLLISSLLNDNGIQKILQTEKTNYFLDNYRRMIVMDYTPTTEDQEQLIKFLVDLKNDNKDKFDSIQNHTHKNLQNETELKTSQKLDDSLKNSKKK